jgi:hypothetical protein
VIAAPPFLFAGALVLGILLNALHRVAITTGPLLFALIHWGVVVREEVGMLHNGTSEVLPPRTTRSA